MQEPAKTIEVMIVDDHPVVRFGLQSMLNSQSQIAVVGTAESAKDAIQQIPTLQPDIVLMDLRMPEIEGAFAISEVIRVCPDVKIVVLTNYESDEDIIGAMKAGALGYLLKNTPQEEIVFAIEQVYENKRYVPPHIADRIVEALGRETLSLRELEILGLVAAGMTNKEIAQRLCISDKTVRNHIASCFLKLDANDRTEAVTKAIKRGIIRLAK